MASTHRMLQALPVLFRLVVFRHIHHVRDDAVGIAFVLLRLPLEVLQNIRHVVSDSLRRVEHLVGLDSPHLLVTDALLCLHGADVVYLELQHVLVSDGIDDGIGVQRSCGLFVLIRLPSESLGGGAQVGELPGASVLGEYRRAGEPEDIVFPECPGDGHVHVTEL